MEKFMAGDNELIKKLTEIILSNIGNENFGVENLVEKSGLTQSYIRRKLRTVKGKTITRFICEVRLDKAREYLQQGNITASEVAYKTGFGSPSYFNKCFHEYFGYAPGELRNHIPESEPEVLHKDISLTKIHQKKILIGLVASLIVLIPLTVMLVYRYSLFVPEKSIAVIPFINDKRDSTDDFFINGVSETITDKLTQIKDLNVKSRNSTERYRNNKTKSTRRIGRELRIRYIVEGSVQRIGDSVLISVQLIEARKDKHFFSRQYTSKYEDIFALYNEIAFDVATNVEAIITPEEKSMIKNSSSEKLEVMRLLIRGNEMLHNYSINYKQRVEYLKQAEVFYRKAIRIDSTNSQVWIQLGNVYLNRQDYDSAMVFAEKAIFFSPDNSKAHLLTGLIHCLRHRADDMERSLKLAIKYDPENYWAIHWLGGLYYYRGEFSKAIGNLFETKEMLGELGENSTYLELRRSELNTLRIFRTLFALGFFEEGKKYADDWLKLSNDDVWGYNYNIQWAQIINQNFEEAYQFGMSIYHENPNLLNYDYLGLPMVFLKNYSGFVDFFKPLEQNRDNPFFGFSLLKTGQHDRAAKLFDSTIKYYDSLLIANPLQKTPDHYYAITDRYWSFPYFMLTATWAVKENKEKAMYYLHLLRANWHANDLQVVIFLKYFPMFENIRNEPEFKEYLNEAETHYLTEREKVKTVLQNKGIIK